MGPILLAANGKSPSVQVVRGCAFGAGESEAVLPLLSSYCSEWPNGNIQSWKPDSEHPRQEVCAKLRRSQAASGSSRTPDPPPAQVTGAECNFALRPFLCCFSVKSTKTL